MRRLGHSAIEITPIGLGCWQFSEGKGLAGRYWPVLSVEETNAIVRATLDAGVNWFDTAEAYGHGRSEAGLARALEAAGKRDGDVVIATKWMPLLRRARSIRDTLKERRRHLGGFSVDLHQVHHWGSLSSIRAQMDAMADLAREGKIRAVGVSNFSARRMRIAHAALSTRGLRLASNQVRYSLLDRRIERDGVLVAARELGITVIAYSPLAQGLLTGRFHDDPGRIRARVGPRRWMRAFRPRGLDESRPVIAALEEISRAHGATSAQVALAWLLCRHGDTVVAIPGATQARHAEENAGAMGLRLTPHELARLDEVSRRSRG